MNPSGSGSSGLHGQNHGGGSGDGISSCVDPFPAGFSGCLFCHDALPPVDFQPFGGAGNQWVGGGSQGHDDRICFYDEF